MLEIIGAPQSSFVRTVRIACEEKGVAYRLTPAMPHSAAVLAVHPLEIDRHNGRTSLQATLPPPFSELTGTSR